jgi:hypothetical protein
MNPHIAIGQLGRRTLHPQIRVIDANTGTVEYIASDESLDSYREIVLASGWRFDRFAKNAPFVDSHNYESIDCLLGRVVDYNVTGKRLVETVKWAIDVPANTLAQKGFAMTQAGYLKAVSVGFMPTRAVTRYDSDPRPYTEVCADLDLDPTDRDVAPSVIYQEQQQIELSACIIGANGNAVAKSYKAGILTDADLELLSALQAKRETAASTDDPAHVEAARERARTGFLVEYQTLIAKL